MTVLNVRLEEYQSTHRILNVKQAFFSQTADKFISVKEDQITRSRETLYAVHPVTHQLVEIDPEQTWFWTAEWQADEMRVEEELASSEYEDFDSIDDFLASL